MFLIIVTVATTTRLKYDVKVRARYSDVRTTNLAIFWHDRAPGDVSGLVSDQEPRIGG